MVHPSVGSILQQGIIPNFPGGITGTLIFFLMANIGTTIAPWMIFFQQSAVVDKGMGKKDIPWGKLDTVIGAIFTILIAVFIVVVTGTLLYGMDIESAAQASQILMGSNPFVGTLLAIGLFNAGLLGAICISLTSTWAFGEVFGWAHSLNNRIREAPWFYIFYIFVLSSAGLVVLIPGAPLGTHNPVCPGDCGHPAPGSIGVPDPPPEQRGDNGRISEHDGSEHCKHYDSFCSHYPLDHVCDQRHFSGVIPLR